MSLAGGIALVLGAAFVLIGAIGVVRFDTATERLHAASKGPTLGLLLIGVGTALSIATPAATIGVMLVIALQLIAGPVGSHMIGRAIHHTHGPDESEPGDGGPGASPDRPASS
jgi:multicomponent Na+:H+ antiporter subunit G